MIPPIQSAEVTQTVDATCRKRVQRSSSGLDHRRCRESKFGISKSLFSCGSLKNEHITFVACGAQHSNRSRECPLLEVKQT